MLSQIRNVDRLDDTPFEPFQASYVDGADLDVIAAGRANDLFFGDTQLDVVEVSVYDTQTEEQVLWNVERDYKVSGDGRLLVPLYRELDRASLRPGADYAVQISFLRKVVWPETALDDAITLPQEERQHRVRRNLGAHVGYKLYVDEISRSRREVRLRPKRVGAPRFDDAFREAFVGFFDQDARPLRYVLNMGHNALYPVLNWVVDRENSPDFPHSVVVKLNRPLADDVSHSDTLWVNEMVFNPRVERVVAPDVASDDDGLVYLRSPNFDTEINRTQLSQTGRRSWEELLGDADVESTEQILSRFIDDRDQVDLNVDYSEFDAFVKFSSAEERVLNFRYKYSLLIALNEEVSALSSQSDPTSSREEERKRKERARLVEGFTGYENYLYERGVLRDPQTGSLRAVDHPAVQQWFADSVVEARRYDQVNADSLHNTLPEFVRADQRNEDFTTFVDMMGEYFDTLWLYTRHFRYSTDRAEDILDPESLSRDLTRFVSDSFGLPLLNGFDLQDLYQYAFTDTDTRFPFADTPDTPEAAGELVQQQVWRRVLNAAPGIAKSKGTNRSIKALLSAYGIPRIGLTVREYGGGSDTDAPGFFSLEDVSHAITFAQDGRIDVDWPDTRVESLECRFRTEYTGQQALTLMRVQGVLSVEIRPVPGDDSRVRSVAVVADGGQEITVENGIPVADGGWNHVVVTVARGTVSLQVGKLGPTGPYEFGDTAFSTDGLTWSSRLTDQASQALDASWSGNSSPLTVGGSFLGDVDLVRVWRSELPADRAVDHALAPARYDFNNEPFIRSPDFDVYDEPINRELIVNLQFTEPVDLTGGAQIENEAFETVYSGQAQASGFPTASEEPWQFVRVRRENLVDPVKIGALTLTDDKVRFADTLLTGGLSPDEKREVGSLDRQRLDSNRLGVFFDPQSGVNDDIVQSVGVSDINSLLARPDDRFEERYSKLDVLNTKYWRKYDRPVDTEQFVRYVEQFNRAFFKQLPDLVPARTNLKRGLVVEPHLLERYRFKQLGVARTDQKYETGIDVTEAYTQSAAEISDDAYVDVSDNVEPSADTQHYEAERPVNAILNNRRFFGDYIPSNNFQTRQAPNLYRDGEYWEQEPIAGVQAGVRNPDSYARERRIPESPITLTFIGSIWDRSDVFHTTFFQSYGSFTVYAYDDGTPPGPSEAVYGESDYSSNTGADLIQTPVGLIQPPDRPYERYRHYIYNREFRTGKRNQLYDGMVYDSSVEGKPAVEITQTTPERLIASPSDREQGRGPVLDVE